MEELFKKIQFSSEEEFNDKEKSKIASFIDAGIIVKKESGFEINSQYRVGKLKIKNNKAILEDLLNEHKNIQLQMDDLNGAYEADLVLVKRIFNPKVKIKAKVIKVLEAREKALLVYASDGFLFTLRENIRLMVKGVNVYNEGDILLISNKTYKLIEKLGNIEDPKIDEIISLSLFNEQSRMENKINIEAQMDDKNQRIDLRSLPFCTIDPDSAKDHDDAIYFDVKENILYVAIADVSYFVKENSELDKIAYKKSTSIYLPGKVLPMLPKELSENMCSLKKDFDRYAYVFKIYLNENNFSVKKSELFEAIIKSQGKYSYGRIDRVLKEKMDQYSNTDKEIFDYLLPLYAITKKLRAIRLKKGYEFRSQEKRIILKQNYFSSVEVESSTPSHQLVEECMLLANVEASNKIQNTAIYRVHEEPSFKAIARLVDNVNLLGLKIKLKNNVEETIREIQKKSKNTFLEKEVDELIIKSQAQAKYMSRNLGHFGLGFKSYTHFTSPIRRYSDLILHRILKTKKIPKNIDEICEYISENERKVDKLVWDFEDRKYARWAKDNIGKEIKIKIIDIQKGLGECYEGPIGLIASIDNYSGQKLFEKTKIIIKNASIFTKEIIGSLKQ